MVVETVLLELRKKCMNLPDNLVGIDYHVNELKILLNVGSNDTQIVGIHGMGGVGKTTIAKFIYNELVEYFERCCFLADIRETAQKHKGLVSLQTQLLTSTTLKSYPEIVDVDSGIDAIKNRFRRKKVLIVLDDLNKKDQFDCLVGNRNWFGSGSRIIITTRDKHTLNVIGVDSAYEPAFINSMQSLELFSMHAFRRRKSPPKDFDNISKKVASTAAGLPLALKVIGSFLSDKKIEVWKVTLKKLENVPDDEVQEKLKISYDGLNHRQKQIFLDIACLFIGMDKTNAFYMWDDLGYYPEEELNNLCLLSLVKMSDGNVFMMHDQLRDLGREIVRQEDFENPGARSRLSGKEALDVVKECKGTEKVSRLFLSREESEDYGIVLTSVLLARLFSYKDDKMFFTSKEFTKLFNLRYLRIYDGELVGDFKHLMSQLRWLRLRNCNFKATNFQTENLIILDLSSSSVTENWKGWNQIKVAKELKVVNLAWCDLRRTPDFSPYPSLEILILKNCGKLVKIDPSIGNLKNLRVLNISGTKIRKLPDEIWTCEKLEVMDASPCNDLEVHIPSDIERFSSLRQLSFSGTKIQSLSKNICNLTGLQTLHLDCCKEHVATPSNLTNLVNLQELGFTGLRKNVNFPRCIDKLSKLQKLRLSYSNITTLPKGFGSLSRLKILTVQHCDDLQSIFGLPSSLAVLSLEFCELFERLPDLSNLKNLLKLKLQDCNKLMEIQGLGELKSLKSLIIVGCKKLKDIQGLGNLESLTNLYLGDEIDEMDELNFLEPSTSLKGLPLLKRLPDLSNLKNLLELKLKDCDKLMEIQGLGGLKSLERLSIDGCKKLKDIQGLGNLESLAILYIDRCDEIDELDLLERSTSLLSSSSSSSKDLENNSNLNNVTHFEVCFCKNVSKIHGLDRLVSVLHLSLRGCESIVRLPNLSNLKMLRSLQLERCTSLREIEGLETLEALKKLNIIECTSLERVPRLPNTHIVQWPAKLNFIEELDLRGLLSPASKIHILRSPRKHILRYPSRVVVFFLLLLMFRLFVKWRREA